MPNYCKFVTIICYHSPVPHSSKKPPPPQLRQGRFGGAGVGYRAMNSFMQATTCSTSSRVTSWLSTLVLTLRPTGLLPLVTDSLPMRLLPQEIMSGSPVRSRDISLGDDPGINGALWDVNRIDITAQQGTWERWTVRSDMPQSFHIEGVSFLIRNVNGAMPFPEDRGWKDTVWVDGQVELLVYYGQPSWPHFPFLFHSQTLEMMDRGSVGQMLINPAP